MPNTIRKFISVILFSVIAQFSYADDIDLIDEEISVNANVLFIMDLSGSMGDNCVGATNPDGSCISTRLSALQGAFQDIVADNDFDKVNFGLSVYSGAEDSSKGASVAHGIAYPISPVTGDAASNTLAQDFLTRAPDFVHPGVAPNNSFMPDAGTMNTREYISLLSSTWAADGSTPIVDALYEATLYFRGEEVNAGKYPPSDIRSAHPATYTGDIFSESITTTTPVCDTSNRVYCAKGSCGPTESCTTNTSTTTSDIDTGGCTLNTGVRAYCNSGETSCGLRSGCTSTDYTYTRFCGSSYPTISSCSTAFPNWYACETYEDTSVTTNSEGQEVLTTTTQVKCKEDLTYYNCDGADNYSCPTTYESCNRCPDDETETTIIGTGTYVSPIVDECGTNGIILLTDGGPTANTTADLVTNKIGTYAQGCQNAPSPGTETQVYGRCGPELAKYLNETDHADGSTSVPDIDGIQNVLTYTVGLGLTPGSEEANYMDDIASDGGGEFVSANDRASLVTAFKDAILGISSAQARSFASPSYSIDASNSLSHDGDVYIPVFDKDGVVWPGNLKKYKLNADGELVGFNDVVAVDANGALLANVRDLWSTVDSTDVIRSGGAANKINPTSRNIKTDNGTAIVALNDSVSNTDFGATVDSVLKVELIKYIKGFNPDDTPRYHMGDIIHSKPVQLIKSGTTSDTKTIFVGTNEGFLHGFNDADGTELFAYMPSELLPNIQKQYTKAATNGHIYGVDGPITLWIDETSTKSNPVLYGNGKLDDAYGEKAYLFFGLRRGGYKFYALDVTNPADPQLVWEPKRLAVNSGNSWSQPVVAMLKTDLATSSNPPKPVLVIGGGYSEDADGDEIPAEGNAVYIIDAIDSSTGGDIIWQTPTSSSLAPDGAIANAIPSRIRVIDIDRNGSIDRLFFGDTGGNIWRVDLNASYYDTNAGNDGDLSKATLYKVAELGGSGTENRKFFEEPDVAIFRQAGKYVATIAIGSGDRTRPLDQTVDDKFYVLYDKEVFIEPTASMITMDSSTGGLKASNTVALSDLSDATFRGWHKDLTSTNGEKVLASAVTYNNKVLFTTFGTTSVTTTTGGCSTQNTNEARLYIMDLLLGVENTNEIGGHGEILGTPHLYFGELKQKNSNNSCDTANGDMACVREVIGRVGKAGPFAIPAQEGGIAEPETMPRVYWFDNEKI